MSVLGQGSEVFLGIQVPSSIDLAAEYNINEVFSLSSLLDEQGVGLKDIKAHCFDEVVPLDRVRPEEAVQRVLNYLVEVAGLEVYLVELLGVENIPDKVGRQPHKNIGFPGGLHRLNLL